MKKLLFFLFCTIHFATSHAQCDSVFIKQVSAAMYTVALFDTNHIIAAGFNGNIIKSENAGKTWRAITTPTSKRLKVMQFPTDSVGYIAGDGIMLKTEDQGENWIPLTANASVSMYLNGLYFFDKDHGFMVGDGGLLLATTDGGRNWKDTLISFGDDLYDIAFINDSVGFICGSYGVCFKTTDRAATWQAVTLPVNRAFRKLRFINDSTGFIIGSSGCCLKTTNAGLSWSLITTNTSESFVDIFFVNAQTGFMLSSGSLSAAIHKTTNGGNNWTRVLTLPIYESLSGINSDPQRKKIVFAGSTYYQNRLLMSTSDAGASYNYLSRNTDEAVNDFFCINDSTVYVAASDGIFMKTNDHGESWTRLQNIPGSLNGQTPEQRKIFFLDSLNGFAYSTTTYRTSDGGKSWIQKTTPGNSSFYVTAIHFSDTLTGLAQDNHYVYKTSDAGNTWQLGATSPSFYTDFAVTPSGKAFAVGYNGSVQVSTDTGTTWATYNLNATNLLTCAYFYNDHIGYIGTSDTTLFKTTDGGTTWSKINIGANGLRVKSILFINDSSGYMIRAGSIAGATNIYKTNNGGLNWFSIGQYEAYFAKIRGAGKPYFGGPDGHIFTTDSLQKPSLPGYIQGLTSACNGFKANYITGPVDGVTYNWSLSGGGTNFPGTNRDTVLWNTLGQHTISLTVSNACGISPVRQLVVNAVNFTPVITVTGSVFTATSGLSYQWYKSGSPIASQLGGQSQSITPVATGGYTVLVKSFYGCSVLSSTAFYAHPVTTAICPNDTITFYSNILSANYQWQRDTGTGFENISNSSYYTGTNTIALQLTGIPSSWYGYRFRCISSYLTTDAFTLQFKNEWTGVEDYNWENPANWSCGRIPDENTDVLINSGNVAINSDVIIRSLTLNPAANLLVQPGKSLTITH